MKNILFFIFIFSLAATGLASDSLVNLDKYLHEGDLIFHQSQSEQSAAIAEATGSAWSHVGIIVKKNKVWYVVEARRGVEATLLTNFIERGRSKYFKIFRLKAFTDSSAKGSLHQVLAKYMGMPYDIYFEFSGERIYCSELSYKVMLELTGEEIGVVNLMEDLRLDGPYVKELIQLRLTDLGKVLDPKEPIVSPVSQMIDKNLQLVFSNP